MMDNTILNENNFQYHFDNVKNHIIKLLETNSWDLDMVCDTFVNCNEIIKTAIEHGFRYYIFKNFKNLTNEDLKQLLDFSVNAAEKKLCSSTTPIFIINDILNNFTIDECSNIFNYLEESAHIWKSELFYSSVKNYLLRMCNDLLKRLSKSQNTVFSGRIHLFLAKLFPLNEKSGLNLMSHFSENTTRYATTAEFFEQAFNKDKTTESTMDLDGSLNDDESNKIESQQQAVPIDFNLYKKFWSLQDFFSKPNSLFEKPSWKQFVNNTNEVLDVLRSYKLEDLNSTSKKNETQVNDDNIYFSKYLTSPKLLDLQLNDSNFRRQIFVQYLIIFQYLHADVKFKNTNQVTTEEQNTWIKNATTKVYQLLKETPPDGELFAENVKHILDREEIWNKWKNEGCPNFVRDKRPASVVAPKKAKRPKPLTSDFLPGSTKTFYFSNPEMAKLCNVNHDNLTACTDQSRKFIPSLREVFEEAIEQLDPANQIEKQFFLINKTEWSWKALRLLAKKSAFYFMQNQNVRTIPEYLEVICHKLEKEFQNNQSEQAGSNESEITQPNEDETVQLNDEVGQNNPGTNTNVQNITSNIENIDCVDNNENNDNINVENPKDMMTREERIIQLKQEFQMDEYQDQDSQSSTHSNNSPRFKTEIKTEETPMETNDQHNDENLVNESFINYLSNKMKTINEWKKLAEKLEMDEDTIAYIESNDAEVNKQCKKILQLWKEREEKQAFKTVVLTALNHIGYSDLAIELEKIV